MSYCEDILLQVRVYDVSLSLACCDHEMKRQLPWFGYFLDVVCCDGVGMSTWPFSEEVNTANGFSMNVRRKNRFNVIFGETTTESCDHLAKDGLIHYVDKVRLFSMYCRSQSRSLLVFLTIIFNTIWRSRLVFNRLSWAPLSFWSYISVCIFCVCVYRSWCLGRLVWKEVLSNIWTITDPKLCCLVFKSIWYFLIFCTECILI